MVCALDHDLLLAEQHLEWLNSTMLAQTAEIRCSLDDLIVLSPLSKDRHNITGKNS